jgi:galactokinase
LSLPPQAVRLREEFARHFSGTPRIFRAPGRVNLIGEHTDYNDGFVMPAAIDSSTWIAIASRTDRKLTLRSANFPDAAEFDLDNIQPGPTGHWSDFVRGVPAILEKRGHKLGGANVLIYGEVPIGAGLSSSAAIEVASGYAFLTVFGSSVDRSQLALAAQEAEHVFGGTRCGIMDQFISANGRAGHALMLDTRSLKYELLPMPPNASVVICNTMVKHNLAEGEYNRRREECEAGVKHLAKSLPHIKALRDVSLAELEKHGRDLPEVIFRRCRHVITENHRVLTAASALRRNDCATFGKLMYESHRSLRDDYEVSCRELDIMVELAAKLPGIHGARMTGGGFGGSTVNLVDASQAESFRTKIAKQYESAVGKKPEIYISQASEGAQEVPLS